MSGEIKLTCCTADGRAAQIEVSSRTTFEDIKSILAAEFSVKPEWLILSYKGDSSIPDIETVGNQGLQNHDMLLVIIQRSYSDDSVPLPPPAQARTGARQTPVVQGQRMPQQQQPQGDGLEILPPFLRGLLQAFQPNGAGGAGTGGQLMFQPPPRPQINRERAAAIDENMELAMAESPESFASVYMLYIDVYINDVLVKAFVDSGAQTTVMSRQCAERTGVIGLVDPRFAGIAVGVGQARILGRVHLAPVKITGTFYNCSFAVLDAAKNLDLLLGLDMLKKYQCNINLKDDQLEFGSTGQVVKFLPENQLPPYARLHYVRVKQGNEQASKAHFKNKLFQTFEADKEDNKNEDSDPKQEI